MISSNVISFLACILRDILGAYQSVVVSSIGNSLLVSSSSTGICLSSTVACY